MTPCHAAEFAALERKWKVGPSTWKGQKFTRWRRAMPNGEPDPTLGTGQHLCLIAPKALRDLAKITDCSCAPCRAYLAEYHHNPKPIYGKDCRP